MERPVHRTERPAGLVKSEHDAPAAVVGWDAWPPTKKGMKSHRIGLSFMKDKAQPSCTL